jgi:hypothetical protein
VGSGTRCGDPPVPIAVVMSNVATKSTKQPAHIRNLRLMALTLRPRAPSGLPPESRATTARRASLSATRVSARRDRTATVLSWESALSSVTCETD